MNKIYRIYDILCKCLGPQGWWPIVNNQTLACEYGLGAPRNDAERFEICIGAILTQNTSWRNVEKAIKNLKEKNILNKETIKNTPEKELALLIKPAGYYNQKAKKLKTFVKFDGRITRENLLNIWGLGPETVDSILLYAYNKPIFVIDAYTKRVMNRLGYKEQTYDELQSLFMKSLPEDTQLFNEFHALLVELGKNYCKTKPLCEECPIKKDCSNN